MLETRVNVKDLRKLHRALKDYDQDLKRELEDELRKAGELAQDAARSRFSAIDATSAAGIKFRTRGFGRVEIQQTRKRVTGQRSDFGSLIMRRGLVPGRAEAYPKVMQAVEGMLDRLGRDFNA